ncbi:MAG: hypothetical protein LW806_01640 [Planctomycetaceae bacterium]|nr:hypothetical protein [Planctomycetaceae bacterium]
MNAVTRSGSSLAHSARPLGMHAGVTALGASMLLASVGAMPGCMQQMDPKQARAEFSSKNQSIANAQSAGRPTLVLPPVGSGPVELSAPTIETGTEARAREAIEIARLQSNEAQSLLRAAARSSWAALRAHAIEAAVANPELLAELAPAGLADENRGVRFVTCMAIAEKPSADLAVLVQPLVADESDSVKASAMLALSRCGKSIDPGPIAAMAFSNNPEVRSNAYLVLGEMGNRTAVPLIYDSLTKGLELVNPVRVRLIGLAASEALVKLGQAGEIEPIRAALFAPPEQSELTVVACGAVGRLKDEVARPMLERLLTVGGDARRSPEIRLSAATALMELGGNPKLAVAVAQEYLGNSDPRIRAVVAVLLGKARCPEATTILTNLIRDTDPTVQVAAAAGLEAMD